MPDQTLKMRGRLIPAHQIPVRTTDTELFTSELKATLSKAPQLFLQAPCVLDISELESSVLPEDIEHQINACRDSRLVPFAITSQSTAHKPLASQLKLAWFEANSKAKKPTQQSATISETQVVSHPVRSGQQIYAKDAHLLITSQVSAGAEVIADGNIHVLGALRGRAIAGASGDSNSVIVAQKMNAELVSIAGTYCVQDDFPEGNGSTLCKLADETLSIEYY